MSKQNCGESFLAGADDSQILEINSPEWGVTGGPYKVVYKDLSNYWAIVALNWGDKKDPCLGIRWFYHTHGYPHKEGTALWFIIPTELSENILSTLAIDDTLRTNVTSFLSGQITGDQL